MEDLVYETNDHPMCIGLYDQLCAVRGFKEMNGFTYEGYVDKWRARTVQAPATLGRVGALNSPTPPVYGRSRRPDQPACGV
jgi:hypothetical protein